MHPPTVSANHDWVGRIFDYLSHLVPERGNLPRQMFYAGMLTAFALLVRLAIAPVEGGIQYVTFFPAVAISAVIGGIWPGLFSALLGALLATFWFWPPFRGLTFDFGYHMVLSNTVFLIDAVLVCTSIEAMHRFYRKFVDAERELSLAASVFQNSAEGIVVTDENSIILSVNPAFSQITGYAPEEAIGQKISLLRSQHHDKKFYGEMWSELLQNGCWQGKIWNRRKNGETFLEWTTINRIANGGGPIRYVAVFHDITELHIKEEYIRHIAFHDALTGLPNRVLLQDRLTHAIERARRDNTCLLVAFIDLDRFKEVNDTLGHDVGDLLLQEVAGRIKGRLRASDTAVRMGGDEFVILMEDVDAKEQCTILADDLITGISRPMQLRGHEVQVGASIGMALYPEDGTNLTELMKHADTAMYAAKSAGRNTYRFFMNPVEPSRENAYPPTQHPTRFMVK